MSNAPNAGDGDKRSVSTDALETLGMIHFRTEHRDAIHLAVEPVVAGQELQPGEQIGFDIDHKVYRANQHEGIEALGIVDPFLTAPVQPGQSFWLVVMPRKITSLRHVWSHPMFPDAPREPLSDEDARKLGALLNDPFHQSMQWMENYLEELNEHVRDNCQNEGYTPDLVTMDELLDTATSQVESSDGWGGDYLSRGGAFEGVSLPREFWEHFERVKRIKVPEEKRNNFFSCSC